MDAAAPACPSSPIAIANGDAAVPSSPSSPSSSSSSVEYVPAAPKKRARNEPKPRRLYHIVFSCPKAENRENMRTPESVGKEAFGKLVEEKLETLWQGRNKLLRLSCFEEIHQSGEKHFHCPLVADKPFVSGPLHRALKEDQIHVYIETSHEFYWSLMCYLSIPTAEKPDIDRNPYLSSGHPSILSCLEDIPRGASKGEKDRCRAYLGKQGSQKGNVQNNRCMDHREFGLFVTSLGLRTRTAVLAALHDMEGDEKRAAEQYIFKFSTQLEQRIAFAFDYLEAPAKKKVEDASLWDIVCQAKEGDCLCGNKWANLLESNLAYQVAHYPSILPVDEKPEANAVRAAHVTALQKGASKHTNVFCYGPRNAGKSFSLDGLAAAVGDMAFLRPAGRSNYPLEGLINKKCAILQDVRPGSLKLSWDALLVWLEGGAFSIPRPRNLYSCDFMYSQRAPVFASSGDKWQISLEEALRERVDPQVQTQMMHSRFKFFAFGTSRPQEELIECVACGKCYLLWVQAGLIYSYVVAFSSQ